VLPQEELLIAEDFAPPAVATLHIAEAFQGQEQLTSGVRVKSPFFLAGTARNYAKVFVSCKYFQPSIMFAVMTGAYKT
jgi:hypothetical protein